jgi:cholesterol transport system auxiliary component
MRGAQNDRALLISETSVSPFYDTQSLVFSRAPGQRAYYQFAAWSERPGSRLTELLIHRLYARGTFRSVTATTAGAKGDLVLNTRLEELCHDASASPGSVRIEMSAVLVDRAQRAIVAQRSFAQSTPIGGDTAPAAVAAFERAVTALLDEESAWVEDMAARPAQQ